MQTNEHMPGQDERPEETCAAGGGEAAADNKAGAGPLPGEEKPGGAEGAAEEVLEEATAEELAQRLEEAEKQRDEYLDTARRIMAEFDNFRRRNNAVRSEAWEDGSRETIALMLPVIDNLERALDAAKDKTPLRDGVELVHKQMLELLERRGVSVINRAGEPFDPELENAVLQAEAGKGEPGTVCEVFLKGYKTASRVIRHAMVSVFAAE